MEIDDLRQASSTGDDHTLSGDVPIAEYDTEVRFGLSHEQKFSRKRKFGEITRGDNSNASSSDHLTASKTLHEDDECDAYENAMILCDPQIALRALQVDENLAGFDSNALFSGSKPASEALSDMMFYVPQQASDQLDVDRNSTGDKIDAAFVDPLPLNKDSGDEDRAGNGNFMVSHNQPRAQSALPFDENGVLDDGNAGSRGVQRAINVLHTIERYFENNTSVRDGDPTSKALQFGEIFRGHESNASGPNPQPISISYHSEKGFDVEDGTNAIHGIQAASILQIEESLAKIGASASISFPESSLKASLLDELSFGDENNLRMRDPLSHSKLLPVENESRTENDAVVGNDQSVSTRKKLILTSAVAAVFSTLTVTLASVGELLVQLQDQMRGMSAPTSSSFEGESSLHRYFSGMQRSSSSLHENSILVFLFLLMIERKRTQKRARELTGPWYIKPRSVQLFQCFLDFNPREDPERFRELFRISPGLFYHICEMVADEMLSDTPRSLRVLPNRVLTVERQVAIALRRLATGNQFLGIADSFGVSKSTAVKVTWKFILAFIKKASSQYLQWPQGKNLQDVKDKFRNNWGFPNCCGVVDGTHFTVEFPKGEDVTSYYDCKNHVSISMQAIVDSDLRFLDVVVGWPGSIQDYQLLCNTNFYKSVMFTNDRLNGDFFTTQDGSCMREYILGDGGYPLYDWLIVPYPNGLSAAKDAWNLRHSAARNCADDALRRLKGTWRLLSRILWKPRKERIGKMVFACCLLHNMIIDREDGLSPHMYEGVEPHPGGYSGVSVPTTDMFEGGAEARDTLLREVIGAYM